MQIDFLLILKSTRKKRRLFILFLSNIKGFFPPMARIPTLVLVCLLCSGVAAIQVDIPQPQYEVARGDNVTLPCTFKSTVANPSLIVIKWSILPDTADGEDTMVYTYYYPSTDTDIGTNYETRASFDLDVPTGRANLKLSSVTLDENKVFQCEVLIPKDTAGHPADTARLVVLVAPSTPICGIQGTAEYGQNINLTCVSKEGSPPPTYKWESRDVQNTPRPLDPKTIDKGGVLSLFNVSKDTSGYFICTSANKIRSATCNFTLSVMPPSMKIGSTAAIAGGAVAVLLLLIIVVCCCCYRKKKKEKQQEEAYHMGHPEEEFHDKEPEEKSEIRRPDGQENRQDYDESSSKKDIEQRDQYEERSERGYDKRRDYDDRRSDYDDRRSDYDDRRSDYNDRRRDHDDRRSDYDDRRSDYDDRRSDYNDRRNDRNDRDDRRNDRDDRRNDYNDRRSDYDDRRSDYNDRRERYDDNRRDRRYDDRD